MHRLISKKEDTIYRSLLNTAQNIGKDKKWCTIQDLNNSIVNNSGQESASRFRLTTGHDWLTHHLARFDAINSDI